MWWLHSYKASVILLLCVCTQAALSASATLSISVDPAAKSDTVGPAMYGAGIETYNHGMYGGLWSNMVYDDSIEDARLGSLTSDATQAWYAADTAGDAKGKVGSACSVVAGGAAFNGAQALALSPGCRAINRGLVVTQQAGSMHFEGGRPYEGYVFTKSLASRQAKEAASVIRVSLLCAALGQWGPSDPPPTVLGSVNISSQSGAWAQANFTVTPSRDCRQSSDGARHGAESGMTKGQGLIMVELLEPSVEIHMINDDAGAMVSQPMVLLDKLMVEPGPWGRYTTPDGEVMHVRKDLADAFLGQRPTIMRLGGSMTNAGGFRFADQVGPPWLRPPTDSSWVKHTSWGFGMFEFLRFALSVPGMTPVLCVNFDEDMPGLLTYLFGGANTTWGRQRIADGHPAPYAKFPIICSNEEPQQACDGKWECYVRAFRAWANATKTTAVDLGVWPLTLGVALDSGAHRYYNQSQTDEYRGGAAEMLQAIEEAQLGEVLWDQHGDGGVAAGWGDFGRDWASILSLPSPTSMEAQSRARGKWVKAIMLEENGGGCGLSRALGHVSNSLTMQRIGHQVAGLAAAGIFWPGPQGAVNDDYQIKFLADNIVRAPFWHANKMLSESHQPNVVGGYRTNVSATTGMLDGVPPFADWMAAVSDDSHTLVIRVESAVGEPVALTAHIAGVAWGATTVTCESVALWHSDPDARNDFNSPDNVVPQRANVTCAGGELQATLRPNSFTVITLKR